MAARRETGTHERATAFQAEVSEDEATPSVEQTREEIEALLGSAVAELKNLVGGKSKATRIKCPACATETTHDIKVADADLLVKAVSALSMASTRFKDKDDATSVKAVKLNADLAALSSAELAERIIALEELILVHQQEGI